MERENMRTHFASTIAIALLFSASTALAFESFPICTHEGIQRWPAVSNGIVVWEDSRNFDTSDPENWDIYGRSLETGITFMLCGREGGQTRPAISGAWVLWSGSGINLSTGQEITIGTIGAEAAVDGNTAVWHESGAGQTDLFARVLPDGPKIPICASPGNQSSSDISGDLVVWEDERNGAFPNTDIYGYDLEMGRELVICASPGLQHNPATSGRFVVWTDHDVMDPYAEIWALDRQSGVSTLVSDTAMRTAIPDISGSIMVWQDKREDLPGIYARDLLTGKEFAVCTEPDDGAYPVIDGDLVVWTTARNGDLDIYGTYIPEPVTLSLLALGVPALRRRKR
jgi:beta propeller repeat protein